MFLYLYGLNNITILVIEVIAAVLLMTLELVFCEIAKLQLRHQGHEWSTSED